MERMMMGCKCTLCHKWSSIVVKKNGRYICSNCNHNDEIQTYIRGFDRNSRRSKAISY